MVNCMYLAIKFENQIVTKEFMDSLELNIDNLFTEIVPFYKCKVFGYEQTGMCDAVPFNFVCAYSEICRINKSELYYYIPLLKLSSSSENYTKKLFIKFQKNKDFWQGNGVCGDNNFFICQIKIRIQSLLSRNHILFRYW